MQTSSGRTTAPSSGGLVTFQRLAVTACLLGALAMARGAARAREQGGPSSPVYLDSAEGIKRLEQSGARQSFVPLSMYFVSQDTQTFCGLASSTMVLNSLAPKETRPKTPEWSPYRLYAQSNFFTDAVKKIYTPEKWKNQGITLGTLGEVLATFPIKVAVSHASDKSEDAFRTEAKRVLSQPDGHLVVNYLRSAVAQVGEGHISPLVAYHEASDSFLIYDVARYKYPPSWVRTKDLWDAMNTTDSDSGKTRGYLVVKRLAR